MGSSVARGRFFGFHQGRRLSRVVMVPTSNAQNSPKHGGGNGQPAANQHHDCHCQAHRCLLFALRRAHTTCK